MQLCIYLHLVQYCEITEFKCISNLFLKNTPLHFYRSPSIIYNKLKVYVNQNS